MIHFFLFKDALVTSSLDEFETGITLLNEVIATRNLDSDNFIRFEGFWTQSINHGFFYEIPSKLNKEFIGLSCKLFNSFTAINDDIESEADFEILYGNDCKGFCGFNFSATSIKQAIQIWDKASFDRLKISCGTQNAYQSIELFWKNRALLFPNLVFCENVWDQIRHLSPTDDRFSLINEKLKRLNIFTGQWKEGHFNFKNLGLNNSHDTPKRIADTLDLRTFACPGIGSKVFSLHIKWSFSREFFRLYYFPNDSNRKVYIGYIGDKADIGF